MRYDTSIHMSLNESIRQIGSREHAISIIENIVNDIFHRADVLLESEEFFIEFYADYKNKLNLMLSESVMTEDQFNEVLYPLIVEGLWSKLMGEKLPTDEFKAKIDAIHNLANQAYRGSKEGNTELQGKAQEFRSRMVNKLKQEYMEKAKNQGGLRGFGRRLMDKLGGSSVFKALGAKPYTELELEGPYRNPEKGTQRKNEVIQSYLSNAREKVKENQKQREKEKIKAHIDNTTHPTNKINQSKKEDKRMIREPDQSIVSEPKTPDILPWEERARLNANAEADKKAKETSEGRRDRKGRYVRRTKPTTEGENSSYLPGFEP